MKTVPAISWLLAAKRHVAEHERYRWWPLYSACLAAFMYSTFFWPWSMDTYIAYRLEPWLVPLSQISWNAGLYLCVGLGAVGLMRSSWIARGLSIYGIWIGLKYLTPVYWNPFTSAWTDFTWYVFDVPAKWIHGFAGEGTGAATCLWFVYFVVVWIAIRPLLKRAYVYVPRLEARLLERWPAMHRFSKPVM